MSLDRFKRPLATEDAADSAKQAACTMRDQGVGDDGGRAVGIVTSDDLLVMLGRSLADVCEGIENRSDATDSC
jgi:hypothetical protein